MLVRARYRRRRESIPSLSEPLSPAVRRVILGITLTSFGNGLMVPFNLILLHEVHGIALSTTGVLLAIPAVVALLTLPLCGAAIDRFGSQAVLRGALVIQAAGNFLLARASGVEGAACAGVLLGVSYGLAPPAGVALLSSLLLKNAAAQARAFALQFTSLNAFFGAGALTAAVLVDVRTPSTFTVLYVVGSALCLVQVPLVPRAPALARDDAQRVEPSYREVIANRAFRRVCLVAFLFALTGHAAATSGLPAYARAVGHVEARVVGIVFAVNTAIIVIGQLALVRLLKGRRRTTALVAAAVASCAAWGSLALVPELPGSGRAAMLLGFGALLGVGEMLLAPTLGPLINALATDRLRGRYNAVSGGTQAIALIVSPALATACIDRALASAWLALLVLCSVGAGVVACALRGLLSDEQEGRAIAEQ